MADKKKPKTAKSARAAPSRTRPGAAKVAKSAAAKQAGAQKRSPARRKASRLRSTQSASSGFDIVKLMDHPLVADLLAVGAMAAVAAIADHNVKTRTGEAQSGSSRAVKAAGKAAAAAIGKRLLSEVNAVRNASKAKATKRGSR